VPITLKYLQGSMVEIGCGASTNILVRNGIQFGLKLFTCDISKNLEPKYEHHKHFHGNSFAFMQKLKEDKEDDFTIVVLDGCHDAWIVRTEFNFFYDRLKPGGLIFIHDTYPSVEEKLSPVHCSDVYRVRQEIERDLTIPDCFTWQYTAAGNGLTMVTKRPAQRPYYQK